MCKLKNSPLPWEHLACACPGFPCCLGWGWGDLHRHFPQGRPSHGPRASGVGDDGGHSPPQQLHSPCCTDQSLYVVFAGVNFGATDLKIIVVMKRFETPSLSATHQGG